MLAGTGWRMSWSPASSRLCRFEKSRKPRVQHSPRHNQDPGHCSYLHFKLSPGPMAARRTARLREAQRQHEGEELCSMKATAEAGNIPQLKDRQLLSTFRPPSTPAGTCTMPTDDYTGIPKYTTHPISRPLF